MQSVDAASDPLERVRSEPLFGREPNGKSPPRCRNQDRVFRLPRLWGVFGGVLVACAVGCRAERANHATPGRSTSPPAVSYFREVSHQRGVDFVHEVGTVGKYFMPEIMGAGGALFDYDNDGDLDIYLVNGEDRSKGASRQLLNHLFRQESDGSFVDVTKDSGLGCPGFGMGVAVGDADNDGDLDVYVSNYGADHMYANNGDGTFTDITDRAGIANPAWGVSAGFLDYDGDGWLDLFVTNYVDYYPGVICENESGQRDYCGPKDFQGTVDRLFHNRGLKKGLAFEDVTVSAGIASASGRGLGLLLRDFNGDARPDIYVNNDMQPNRLWMQQPDGTFHDEAMQRGVAYNGLGEAEASMGIASGDFNGDARADLFLAHFEGETCTLYESVETDQFRDATASAGLAAATLIFNSFGTAATDLDCDGDLDLIVVNGRVMRGRTVFPSKVPEYWKVFVQPNLLFFNDGAGRFRNASGQGGPLTELVENSRALVSGDVDNDGDIDYLVTNCGGRARLFINDVPRNGHWLMLRVLDPHLHRDAVGATVTVIAGKQSFWRDVSACSSYASSNDPRLHFGLGDAQTFDEIQVVWSDGERERFPGGPADRQLVIRRGEGQVAGAKPRP